MLSHVALTAEGAHRLFMWFWTAGFIRIDATDTSFAFEEVKQQQQKQKRRRRGKKKTRAMSGEGE
jgi:hypothetical protein